MSVFLREREIRILRAFSDAVIPAGGTIPFSASELRTAEKVDSGFSTLPDDVKKGTRYLLRFINIAPLFTRFKTFVSMKPQEREKYIESWMNSRFQLKRNIFVALKGLAAIAYYGNPEVEKIIGYAPKCLKE